MGCGASQAARVEPEDQVQKNGSPSATSEKKEDSLKVDSPARQRFEEQPTKPGLRVPSLAGGLKTGSAELTSVQAFELKAQHSIIPRRDKSPSARHALPDSAEGLGPISPITRGPLPPVADGGSPARSTRFNSALRQRPPEDHLPGLPLGNEPLFVPSPVRRGSDATGSPLPSSRVPSNGLTARGSPASARNQRLSSNGTQAPTGILKANSRENGAMGGGRSVRAPGGRSIMFKDNNTFVFDRDASDEEDLTDHEYLDETDSCGLRIGPGPSFNPAMPLPDVRSRPSGAILTPMRLESLNDKLALSGLPPGHPHGLPHSEPLVDLASGLSFANARAGSQALLSKKGGRGFVGLSSHLGAACPGGTPSTNSRLVLPDPPSLSGEIVGLLAPPAALGSYVGSHYPGLNAGSLPGSAHGGSHRASESGSGGSGSGGSILDPPSWWSPQHAAHAASLPIDGGPWRPQPRQLGSAPAAGLAAAASPSSSAKSLGLRHEHTVYLDGGSARTLMVLPPPTDPSAPADPLEDPLALLLTCPPAAGSGLAACPALRPALLQPLLPPSKMFKSGESQAAMGANLPPVKNSGHRSIGSRSIAGVRSEISFAIPNRDVTTPAMKGRSGPSVTVRHAPSRVESAVSSAGGSMDSTAFDADGNPIKRSHMSRLGPESEADSEFPSGDDGDNGSHSKRYKHVRNGKEWDAKGARWRRASAFQSSAHCAISLRFLRKILTEYVVPLAQKLQVPLDKVTTLTVNEMIVKQLTMEEQCRLVDVPGLVPKEDVGEPDYFISHAWGNPFAHLVQCVCDHLSGALDSTKVWIDIAAVNQHPTEQQQDDLANLRNAIFKSKATLMCLDVTGAPLKRVWCLYECDNTITIHGPDRLVLLTPNFSVKDMASVFKSINVMDAGVYKQSDKDKIIEDIVAHHGSTTAFDNKLKLLFLLEPLDTQAELESLLEGTTGAHEYDFTPVQMWITSPRAPQVCVISGPAGSGKSTISAALCWDEDMQQRRQKAIARGQRVGSAKNAAAAGQVLLRQMSNLASVAKPTVHAYHFCKYSDVRRQSPIRIVKTLAYQLAQRLPLLRSYYAGLDLAQVLQLHQASTAFRLLLLKPLTTLLPRDEQIVVLIDAMDEADSHAQLPLDNSVLQLMLHQLSCLPRNVKIITSTRSAPHLMGPLRRKFHGALELTPSMVRKRESTLIQLERRLALRFGEASAKAAMSTGAGESNLVYYSVLMLVDPPLDKVPGSLQECYTVVFAAQWKQLTKAQQAEVVKVLQVLMAAREPLQLSLLAGLGLEHVLENLPGWGTLLYEREYKVYSLHKSLNDWLTDPAAGPYHADPRVGDATLGRYLFNAAHPLPSYGAKYLVSHLLAAGPKLKELLDQAVTDLDHLEAVCRVGYVFRLHQELAAAETKSRAVSDVVRWLGLNSHVLWAHPAAVVQLANEAPNNSAFMIALRRPRRSSTITTELMAAAGAAVGGGAVPHMGSGAPVTLLNKKRSWPAQLSILAQHHRAVNSVAFNPSGTLLVSGSEDKSVRVWDPLTGEQKAVLFGHTGQVLGVAFSSNGQLIASGSVDSTVRVWDASTGEEKCALDGHTDWVRDVAFSPGTSPGANGRWIASCGDDKTVRVWEVGAENPVLKYTLNGHTDVVYSLSFSPGGELLASGSADMSIRVWDPAAGRQSGRALVAHKFAVTAITFSPDGQWLASASHDKVILLWELAAARETGMPSAELTGHLDKILDLAYNPDGSQLVSASADGSLRIWDVPSRRVRGVLLGHASGVVAAAFSPSGAQVASAASDNTVRLWDPRIACENKSVEEASVSHMDCVTCVAFSPSGHTIASAGQDWTVRLWDPSDGNHRALLSGHTDVVRCVAFSPNGGLLASASSDWTVRLWDPVAGTEKALLQGHQDRVLSVTWSLNGRMLASACHDGCIIIWDAASFEKKIELKGHTAPVHTLAFAPSSKSLASGSADRTVRIWQPSLAEQQVMIKGHTGAVNVVEYDATGKLLASSSLEEKMVRVWDPASSMLLCVISNAGLCAAGAFSMYSLARHAPCVRAIALKQRISNSGAAPGGGNTSLSGGAPSVPAFGTSPSFTPHVLQPSMTMRMERNSPNGLVIGAHNSSTEINYNFVFNAAGGVTHSSGGGAPQSPTGTQAGGAHGNGSINGSTGTGTPPVLQTAMSMRSSLSTMDEIPRLMELVSEIDNPIVPIYTQFVSPKCVAVYRNKVVMSDGPHLYFFESNEGKIVGWKNRIQSAAT